MISRSICWARTLWGPGSAPIFGVLDLQHDHLHMRIICMGPLGGAFGTEVRHNPSSSGEGQGEHDKDIRLEKSYHAP